MINYSPTKDISIEYHQVYSSSVSFTICSVLQISHHYIQTLTWGFQKDSLRAIPTQVLAKINLCHTPGPVIPTAIIHVICLAQLFLEPLSKPYAWPHYSYHHYPHRTPGPTIPTANIHVIRLALIPTAIIHKSTPIVAPVKNTSWAIQQLTNYNILECSK